MRRIPSGVLLAALLLIAGAACDHPPPTDVVPDDAVEYFVHHYIYNFGGPRIDPPAGSEFVLRVTGADLDREWVYRVPTDTAGRRETHHFPAGEDRTIEAVLLVDGETTHADTIVATLRPGFNPRLELEPVADGVWGDSLSVGMMLTELRVRIQGLEHGVLEAGDTARLTATVVRPDGSVVTGAGVQWLSTRRDLAYVDQNGLVEARDEPLPSNFYASPVFYIHAVHDEIVGSRALVVKDGPRLVYDTIAHALRKWHDGNGNWIGPSEPPGVGLSAVAFQHSTTYGVWLISQIPRAPVENDGEVQGYGALHGTWDASYVALRDAAWGYRRLQDDAAVRAAFDDARLARVEALYHFVWGLAHATIALHYDRGYVRKGNAGDGEHPPLVSYSEIMTQALQSLQRAAAIAAGSSFVIEAEQFFGLETTSDQLAGIAHALRARFMAAVARTPAERAAVDWNAVLSELDAASTWDIYGSARSDEYWPYWIRDLLALPGWQQSTYFVLGMADTAGTYQKWLDVPVADRMPDVDGEPFLIHTPDQRFAQGTTLEEQTAYSHENTPRYGIPPFSVSINFSNRERGTWRWSYYWTYDLRNSWFDLRWPEISQAELDLLQAEALYRLAGNSVTPEAAALVDTYRTAAGLDSSADGVNDDCVPRLPDGACGDFFEMLKWEKRLETQFRGLYGAPWYFDGRGWGDLYEGSLLHLPVPCEEAEARGEACAALGGVGGQAAAPVSSYGWETLPGS